MIKLAFEDTDDGRKRYEMCWQAVALAQRAVQAAEWDDCADLVRKLKAVGEDAGSRAGAQVLLDLIDGGATVLLEKGEAKLLISFMEQPIWRPLAIDDARNATTWLKAQQELRGGAKKAARSALRLDGKTPATPVGSEVSDPEDGNGDETTGTDRDG